MKGIWEHVVVLGAAGKMGSGIALLLLQEMAWMEGGMLTLLDANMGGFEGLRGYLRGHLRRGVERSINDLRLKYAGRADLIDNGEMVEAFVEEAMDRVRCVTSVEECKTAKIVFEAIIEDVDVKAKVLSGVDKYAGSGAYYFTNTSSIPIHVLQEKSGLTGRVIGFHFYNPPPVQKLLEVIVPAAIQPELKELAREIAKRLKKTVVFSNDVAGFIGNGHFIREIGEACGKVRELGKQMNAVEALCAVNRVTQEFLLRPMGIFQLLDYVGLDVCQLISKIMTRYLPGHEFMDPLIKSVLDAGIKGGQHADGSQKDGFFRYEHGRPVAVYDSSKKGYVPYSAVEQLGKLPEGHFSWKVLSKDKDKDEKIANYFSHLWGMQSLGAELAGGFLQKSREIAQGLIKDGVAHSIADVDTVLQQGFYHLYGVEAPFMARNVR